MVSIIVAAAYSVCAAEVPVSFTREIAPILARKCLTCHNAEKAKGKFRLDTFDQLLMPGGSKEPTVVPGQPTASRLYTILLEKNSEDRMPQKDDPLPSAQIALIERWLREGTVFDGSDRNLGLASLADRATQTPPPEKYSRPVPVTGLAFSPDGQTVASSGRHEILLWNPVTGALLRRLGRMPANIQNIDWSADGRWVAAATGNPGQSGEVLLLDPAGAAPEKVLASLGDLALEVKFSPDGTRLATAGTDNAIRLFEIPSGKELLVIQQHADWVAALAWSPDGTRLASASRDRTARIFDAKTGELETTFVDHNAAVLAVAFSPDGQSVFSSGRDKKILRWAEKDGRKTAEFGGGGDDETLRLAVCGNELYAAGTTGTVRVFNLETRKLVRTLRGAGDWLYGLAIHEPTGHLVSGGFDGEVRLWNTEKGTELKRFIAAPGWP